jgi:uncharacterized membrane protein YqgA involved in biofilm formation
MSEVKPPLSEKLRIPLRVAVVALAYVIYRVVAEPMAAAIFAAGGFLLFGWAVVDGWTTWPRDRSEMMRVATMILGLGLAAIGAYLYVRAR